MIITKETNNCIWTKNALLHREQKKHVTSGWARKQKNPSDEFKLHIEVKNVNKKSQRKKPNYGRQKINVKRNRKQTKPRTEKKSKKTKKVKITTHPAQFSRSIKPQPSPTTASTRTSSTKNAHKSKKMHIHTPSTFFVAFIFALMKWQKHMETQQAKKKTRTFVAAKTNNNENSKK